MKEYRSVRNAGNVQETLDYHAQKGWELHSAYTRGYLTDLIFVRDVVVEPQDVKFANFQMNKDQRKEPQNAVH